MSCDEDVKSPSAGGTPAGRVCGDGGRVTVRVCSHTPTCSGRREKSAVVHRCVESQLAATGAVDDAGALEVASDPVAFVVLAVPVELECSCSGAGAAAAVAPWV